MTPALPLSIERHRYLSRICHIAQFCQWNIRVAWLWTEYQNITWMSNNRDEPRSIAASKICPRAVDCVTHAFGSGVLRCWAAAWRMHHHVWPAWFPASARHSSATKFAWGTCAAKAIQPGQCQGRDKRITCASTTCAPTTSTTSTTSTISVISTSTSSSSTTSRDFLDYDYTCSSHNQGSRGSSKCQCTPSSSRSKRLALLQKALLPRRASQLGSTGFSFTSFERKLGVASVRNRARVWDLCLGHSRDYKERWSQRIPFLSELWHVSGQVC